MAVVLHFLAPFWGPGLWAMLLAFLVGSVVEQLAPAEPRQPWTDFRFNAAYGIFASWLAGVSGPALRSVAIAIANAAGGGLIQLPDRGWGLIGSAAAFIVLMDLMEYLFHRAQHRVPALWAMHSLHHSDRSVNVTTTVRAFWLEAWIKALLIGPVIGVLVAAPPAILTIYGLSKVYDYVNHLNLRVPAGRWWWMVLNGPQYHRIHHSTRREHFDRNFAAFFPIWDVIFGTCHPPRPGEFPATGLDTGDAPQRMAEALLWPARRWLRRTAPSEA